MTAKPSQLRPDSRSISPPLRTRFADGGERTSAHPWATNEHADLIEVARALIAPHRVGDRLFGDVAAALETTTGAIHTDVCIDTGSGTGFCAEHAAIASMVTSGENAIARIVAVWRDHDERVTVLPLAAAAASSSSRSTTPTSGRRSFSGTARPHRPATCCRSGAGPSRRSRRRLSA